MKTRKKKKKAGNYPVSVECKHCDSWVLVPKLDLIKDGRKSKPHEPSLYSFICPECNYCNTIVAVDEE